MLTTSRRSSDRAPDRWRHDTDIGLDVIVVVLVLALAALFLLWRI